MIKQLALKGMKSRLHPEKTFGRAILTHGGTASSPLDSDGTLAAAQAGMDLMTKGHSSLTAAVHAVKLLEDDPRFNAGTGSQRRADGQTIQMDAACMSSDGQFGAVACVENVKNPIGIAQGVLLHSPHIIIAGDGVRTFAQEHRIATQPLSSGVANEAQNDSTLPSCDTVGAVVFDGTTFSAALSSGGLAKAAIGRIGDVPLPGCGLFCGPLGAIACTGDGEFIALKMLAREVYSWLEQQISPRKAVEKAMRLIDDPADVGLIILTQTEFASNARNGMAWAHLTEFP